MKCFMVQEYILLYTPLNETAKKLSNMGNCADFRDTLSPSIVVIRGKFHEGELRGNGYCRFYQFNTTYYGEFKRNKETTCWGHIEYENGLAYDGETINQVRHGYGQLKAAVIGLVDDLVQTPFDRSRLETFGDLESCLCGLDCYFLGNFDDDLPHGDGKLYFANDQVRITFLRCRHCYCYCYCYFFINLG
jgi:hypothetical protein